MKQLLHARGMLKGDLTLEGLLDCALIALPHRIAALRDPCSIVIEVIDGRESEFDQNVILVNLKNMAIPKWSSLIFGIKNRKRRSKLSEHLISFWNYWR
ncbi:MAG: hypothetical protein QMC85_05595 [Methanocellales archaeon]|nr:hypothetical protein [Methanocellales archaeon]